MLRDRPRGMRHPLAYQAAGAQVIAADGALGPWAVEEIERTATAGLDRGQGMIVLDLTTAGPVDDLTLAALLAALRRLRRRGTSIAVVGASPGARDALDTPALQDLAFTLTVRDALRALEPVAPPPKRPAATSLRRRAAKLRPAERLSALEEMS